VDSAPQAARLIRAARLVNDDKPNWVVTKIEQSISKVKSRTGRCVTIACLGLAFKANVDDLRQSPSIEIVKQVIEKKLTQRILVVEPYINVLPNELARYPDVELVDIDSALRNADIIVLLVDHLQFTADYRNSLVDKEVIDTRGSWR
jgi:UDP-N-acetyl-D-mannosaminuronic acid dehydrogenase